jgi:hypothetical protein
MNKAKKSDPVSLWDMNSYFFNHSVSRPIKSTNTPIPLIAARAAEGPFRGNSTRSSYDGAMVESRRKLTFQRPRSSKRV